MERGRKGEGRRGREREGGRVRSISPVLPPGFQFDESIFENLPVDVLEPVGGGQVGMVAGAEDTVPKAVGYLISTSPPGYLPEEFWGYEKPQSSCSMFKVRTDWSNWFS